MIAALELLKAATASERALRLCERALNQHEGVMPRRDAAQLLEAAQHLGNAAEKLLFETKPKRK